MTKFMKFEVIAYYILKGFVYLFATLGVLGIIGFAGGLTVDELTILQFCLYEIHAFGLIGFSYAIYLMTEIIKSDVFKRANSIRHKQQLRRQRVQTACK